MPNRPRQILGLICVLPGQRHWLASLFVSMLLTACGTHPLSHSTLLGEDQHFAVVIAGAGESYSQLAADFYRNPALGWRIEDANDGRPISPGMEIVVPKKDDNRIGVWSDGYQVVPILSYHRFGKGRGRLSVSRDTFDAQMQYLQRNGYHAVSLGDAAAFFRGERALPRKSVVLTIDDGYQSVYEIAYPVLQKYGYPATVFIYSDYIGRGGLTWSQMHEMEQSGLFSFQPHSKTHDNLTLRRPDETVADYKKRLVSEVRLPGGALEKRMADSVFGYAYPFGAVNRLVVDELKRNDYELAATVKRGPNPFFAFPYGLHRTMIYESDGLAEFAEALNVFQRRSM